MTARLLLVHNGHPPARVFEPPPFSLTRQPQRPGELCESLIIDLPPSAYERAERQAQAAGIPLPLWLLIAIEAERAVASTAAITGLGRTDVIDAADEATRSSGRRYDISPPETRRLADYAEALRAGAAQTAAPATDRAVAIRLPHLMLASWALTAAECNVPLTRWAAASPLAPGRERWEATAAAEGLSLSEWLLRQAARRLRSSRTAPQPAA